MNDEQTTVAELRALVARFVSEREWESYHDPKNLSMAIAIEAAELMEHFQWLTREEALSATRDEKLMAEVREELADVAAFLLSLCNSMRVDLASALEQKMQKNAAKYPAGEFRGRYVRPPEQQ
jgi:NTP pyrophosphatase (non-canonical NTP hydrolase)